MKTILAFIAAVLVIAAGCTQQGPIVGNDTDAHGCKISAGYSWCEGKAKCLRPFEENCTVACTAEAKICPDGSAVGRVGPNCEFAPCPQIVGNDSDVHGCKASAGYSWCEAKSKCIRIWEEACEGSLKGSEVWQIAEAACNETGNLTGDITYNPNSKTYWIDLDTVKAGCSPACVVWEENQSAEINWRCTGAIPPYTVKTANTSLGEILVGGDGFTLYAFSSDSENTSTCYGTCAANWPPLLITDTIAIPKGLPGTMGAILRSDNTTQVTYNGKPLYTYVADFSPGDTNGEGVGGKWYVVKVE